MIYKLTEVQVWIAGIVLFLAVIAIIVCIHYLRQTEAAKEEHRLYVKIEDVLNKLKTPYDAYRAQQMISEFEKAYPDSAYTTKLKYILNNKMMVYGYSGKGKQN